MKGYNKTRVILFIASTCLFIVFTLYAITVANQNNSNNGILGISDSKIARLEVTHFPNEFTDSIKTTTDTSFMPINISTGIANIDVLGIASVIFAGPGSVDFLDNTIKSDSISLISTLESTKVDIGNSKLLIDKNSQVLLIPEISSLVVLEGKVISTNGVELVHNTILQMDSDSILLNVDASLEQIAEITQLASLSNVLFYEYKLPNYLSRFSPSIEVLN